MAKNTVGNQMNTASFFLHRHHISPNRGKHPSEPSWTLLMHLSESCVRKKVVGFYKVWHWLWIGLFVVNEPLFVFKKADTASSTRCYCSISRINNRRVCPHNNPSAWTMQSLKSTRSHFTLPHTDTYRLCASLCHSTASSITDKNVRHLEWVRNSCYCIEVLPRGMVCKSVMRCVTTGPGNGLLLV